jgi:hypothetical protein
MPKIQDASANTNRVTVLFDDGPMSFSLTKTATMAELSLRLARLTRRHKGWPRAVSVNFGSPSASIEHSDFVKS